MAVERLVAQRPLAIHADEPLRRGAEDQRRLRAPGMRIGVDELAWRSSAPPAFIASITGLATGDSIAALALGHDGLAGEQRHAG